MTNRFGLGQLKFRGLEPAYAMVTFKTGQILLFRSVQLQVADVFGIVSERTTLQYHASS